MQSALDFQVFAVYTDLDGISLLYLVMLFMYSVMTQRHHKYVKNQLFWVDRNFYKLFDKHIVEEAFRFWAFLT